jgi:hypothetical protein
MLVVTNKPGQTQRNWRTRDPIARAMSRKFELANKL